MIKHRERVQLVEAGNDVTILDVRQPADVEDEVGTTPNLRKLLTCGLNVTISQTKPLADLAQPQSRQH